MKRVVAYSASCIIGTIVWCFWAIPLRGMLNFHEEFQLFQTDADYFWAHLTQPGGIAIYISEFLVQFYNNYWVGALIIAFEFILIQSLTLDILKNLIPAWSRKHNCLTYCLSLIPMLTVWIILGDVNIMHSFIIAVIMALLLTALVVRIHKNIIYKAAAAAASVLLLAYAAGVRHYRIPGMTPDVASIYHPKTIELLDYDLLVRSNRWEEVIRRAESRQPDLPQSVCATNLALGMTGQMGLRAGDFFQNGVEGLFPPFNKDYFSTLTTAEVYFQLGLINTAQRYYFEAMEAIPNYRKSCRCIRRLAETNLINGQYGVARKYLHILEKTVFYRKWARRVLQMIADGESSVMKHPLYGRLRRMRLDEDFLYSDREIDKICGRLLMQNHSGDDQINTLAMQYMLLYPLLENDYDKFVKYMHLVRTEIPYCQEFAYFERYLEKVKR